MPSYQWIITLVTPASAPTPSTKDISDALAPIFNQQILQVSLAGPQSVDDEPIEPMESPSEFAH